MSEENAQPFEFGPPQAIWLEALESGKYKQGRQFLRLDDEYCCLGVLCELAGYEFQDGQYKDENGARWAMALPAPLRDKMGMSGCYGSLSETVGGKYSTLAGLNDDASYTFAQIAAYIRANPQNVFAKAA